MTEDHYQTLGVPRTASAEDIRKAYRELARKYHPDLHPDDEAAKAQFKKVQSAFDVLNDPSKREMYDRYGSSFEGVGAGGPGGGWGGGLCWALDAASTNWGRLHCVLHVLSVESSCTVQGRTPRRGSSRASVSPRRSGGR